MQFPVYWLNLSPRFFIGAGPNKAGPFFMAKQLLDYDADTCVAHYTHTENDSVTLETKFDVEPMLERNKILRNEGIHDLKASAPMHKYCDVDDVLLMKLKNMNINMLRPTQDDWKKFFRVMETDFSYYKVSNKKAWRPKKS